MLVIFMDIYIVVVLLHAHIKLNTNSVCCYFSFQLDPLTNALILLRRHWLITRCKLQTSVHTGACSPPSVCFPWSPAVTPLPFPTPPCPSPQHQAVVSVSLCVCVLCVYVSHMNGILRHLPFTV